MPDVFMSYVEEDSRVAEEIAQGLERSGYRAWYYERDTKWGFDWIDEVSNQILQCDVVVLVISEHSLTSDQVQIEVSWARTKSKRIIPVLFEVSHTQIEKERVQWAMAFGNVVAPRVGSEGVSDDFIGRLVAGLTALGVDPSQTARPDPLEERLAEVRKLLNSRDHWRDAEEALQKVIAEFPDSPRAQQYLGEICNRSFRHDEALAAFERAIALQPGNALLHWDRGVALQRAGRPGDAVTSLAEAIELGLDPTRERHAKTLIGRLGGTRQP